MAKEDAATKTAGAVKAGIGGYLFEFSKMTGVDAGTLSADDFEFYDNPIA